MANPQPPVTDQASTIGQNAAPMPRIIVMELSLKAFGYGLLSLLPVIGLLPAVCALSAWVRIRLRYRDEWNPAADYLSWGASLAVVGLAITAVGIPAVILSVGVYNAQHGH